MLKVVVALSVVLLAGGGGAAWWFLRGRAATPRQAPVEEHQEMGVLALEPFTVNLADREAPSYLRVTVGLVVVGDESHVKELEEDRVRVLRARSAIIELLTAQTSSHLATPEGKVALRKAIAARTRAALQPTEVKDVLFTDFVVQY